MNSLRRSAMVLASAFVSQAAGAFKGRKVVEAAETSAYFAPNHASQLLPGATLNVHRQDGLDYLVYDGDFVGRLPSGFSASSAKLAWLGRDQNGRTRMYIQVV